MGTEHGLAAHGGAFEACGEFFDVAATVGDGGGELADDAGAVLTEDVHNEGAALDGLGGFLAHGLHGEAGHAGDAEFFEEPIDGGGGTFDADDAGELSGEAGHAAVEPVSAVAGDGFGEGADKAGAVTAEHGHDEVGIHE